MKVLKRFGVLFAILLAVMLAGCASSTPGVRVVGDNVIELPVGQTAVFSATNGKYMLSWTVTFDGESDVTFSCASICFDGSAHVPNVGDTDWANSSSMFGRFDVTRVSYDAVHVYWPYGISLQQ